MARTPATGLSSGKSMSRWFSPHSLACTRSFFPSLSSNSILPTPMVYPVGQEGSRLPRIVTRRTVTSSGNSTFTHGCLLRAAASPLSENQLVFGSPSKAWPVGHPGQNVLAESLSLSLYSATREFWLGLGFLSLSSEET